MHNFIVISLAYCSLTFTDGALRTIVLLHCTTLGFSPLEIAAMFMLYEFAGIFTNLLGGILASRQGLKKVGCLGLFLMAVSVLLVAPVQSLFGTSTASTDHTHDNLAAGSLKSTAMAHVRFNYMVYIFFVQGLAGVGKDLMKISGKSITKLVNKKGDNGSLFTMVVYVTGAKNTIKGVGTFMGGVVLLMGYWQGAVLISIFVMIPLPLMLYYVDSDLGVVAAVLRKPGEKDTGPPRFRDAFANISYNVGVLSGARFWLFGARDVWFEIAFPVFLKTMVLWPDSAVSAAMGAYIIMYGLLQTNSPRLCLKPLKCSPPTSSSVAPWTIGLCVLCAISGFVFLGVHGVDHGDTNALRQSSNATANSTVVRVVDTSTLMHRITNDNALWWTISILTPIVSIVFAIFMAVLSSIHSYLIVLYSGRNKVAKDVGFYYMSNAGGRLIGTLFSGILCEYTGKTWGLIIPLWVSCLFLLVSCGLSVYLKPHKVVVEQETNAIMNNNELKQGEAKDEGTQEDLYF